MSDASGSEAVVAAAERVLQHLRTHLARWFGSEGFRALLLRAIDRTRRPFPALARPLPPFEEGEGVGVLGLDELFDNLKSCSTQETRDATVALIAAVIALLGRLVGEDVAVRLVLQSWPELLRGEPRSTGEETRE
jgi:hypothetical protein